MRNVSHLNLHALEMFRHVAVEGSILAASAKLHRVQSNVSTRIKQLEEQVGAALFVRRARGLSLTEDGEVLLRYAEQMLALSNEALDALHSSYPTGEFRIGTMESTAAVRLPSVLSAYHKQFSDVQIHVETDTAGALTNRLLSGDIDVAFIAEPLSHAELVSEPVFVEQLMLISPPSFASLRNRQKINGATMIAFEEGCAYRRYLQDWLSEERIQPGQILSVGSYLAILACVSAGTGLAVVPKSVLDAIASDGDFKCHPLPKKYSKIATLLTWRGDYRSRKLEALRALLPGLR
ncbi:MAG: LysR family transcriptional regulator [Hyphomicrobiaceae bacterium]